MLGFPFYAWFYIYDTSHKCHNFTWLIINYKPNYMRQKGINIKSNNFLLTFICMMTVSVFFTNIIPEYKNLISKCDVVEVEGNDDNEESEKDHKLDTYFILLDKVVTIVDYYPSTFIELDLYIFNAHQDVLNPPPEQV